MKKTPIIFILFFFTICSINAQEWLTDFKQAKIISTKENKKIILVFQGSDWCAPCIKLDKQIWSTDEFKNYAKKHFVMLQADFPRSKKNKLSKIQQEQNNKLAETYNKQGFFPHILILNNKGNVLGRTGYKKISPSEYIKLLTSF
ncbi:MAG: thioredoxin family protein [Flavobacteriaceae bacterium]|nr:thioredoxin family protein [Flavobacteriaceae bacterium]